MKMNIEEFIRTNMLSNTSIDELIAEGIGESQNCILYNMFKDEVILYETSNDDFYKAKWNLDIEDGILRIYDFDKIEITTEDTNIVESAMSYFDGDLDKSILASKYVSSYHPYQKEINDQISKRRKTSSYNEDFDWEELEEAKEEINISILRESKWFNSLNDFLWENPSDKINYIDFRNPISISLFENEEDVVNKMISKKRGTSLWKKEIFRKELTEMIDEWVDNVEDVDLITDLFENYYDFWSLNDEEKGDVIGKALIMENIDTEYNKEQITEGLLKIIRKFDLSPIIEEDIDEQLESNFEEPTNEEIIEIIEKLETIKENCINENIYEEVDSLIDDLNIFYKNGKFNKNNYIKLYNFIK